MAKLWEGKFEKSFDSTAEKYNSSIGVDKILYKEDIIASIAHANMLGKCDIISMEESKALIEELKKLRQDIDSGSVVVDESFEDIHSFVEFYLTEKIGDTAKKLHTARSRNDQVATDFKLYCITAAKQLKYLLKDTITAFLDTAKANINTIMPVFTHLQPAQPSTYSHYLLCYCAMLKRDIMRLDSYLANNSECPLGSCALCGTTYPIDRFMTAQELGFKAPCQNSLDGVSDRDFVVELHSVIAIVSMHLSRLSEEMILFCTQQFQFVDIDESYSTGSSIMPQKKNPDIAELIRGKTGRIYGNLMGILTVLKGLPLAYNKDMQEDKENLIYSVDSIKDALTLTAGMIKTLTVKKDKMSDAAKYGYLNATDCADYLTKKGLPFRDAYKITGKIVKKAIEDNKSLEMFTLEDFKYFCPKFEKDIYEAINIENCVIKRNSYGGPSPKQVKEQIREIEAFLKGVI